MGVNVRPLQPRARARRLDVASPHGSDEACQRIAIAAFDAPCIDAASASASRRSIFDLSI
jgi:hypothetical protein